MKQPGTNFGHFFTVCACEPEPVAAWPIWLTFPSLPLSCGAQMLITMRGVGLDLRNVDSKIQTHLEFLGWGLEYRSVLATDSSMILTHITSQCQLRFWGHSLSFGLTYLDDTITDWKKVLRSYFIYKCIFFFLYFKICQYKPQTRKSFYPQTYYPSNVANTLESFRQNIPVFLKYTQI